MTGAGLEESNLKARDVCHKWTVSIMMRLDKEAAIIHPKCHRGIMVLLNNHVAGEPMADEETMTIHERYNSL